MLDNQEYNSFLLSSARLLVYLYLVFEQIILDFTITKKIFDRFYSNRPDSFGEHSGLGLNIVKNLVDLHGATIVASNNMTQNGANVEIVFPKP